jgi:hypothetical protein
MPSANFGKSSILPVQSGTTSYVKLDLGAFPANSRIAKATLRLYVDAATAPGAFDVYAVNGNWSERGLTANNAPALGASATGGQSIAITKSSVNQFVMVDITAIAQGWLDGTIPNDGVALELTSSTGSFAFASKEASGHHPELVVVLGDPGALTVAPEKADITSASAPASHVAAVGVQQNAPAAYIDNGTVQQTGANFNIDGTGTAANFNATSQYMFAGSPFLGYSAGQSLFVGLSAGQNNTGSGNVFVGTNAGLVNSTGANNLFAGAYSGQSNTTGSQNTFVGGLSGVSNTTGAANAFFGNSAGYNTTTGSFNMFFGVNAGFNNTTGFGNSFVGVQAGLSNVSGNENLFLGSNSGQNSNGNFNTFIGSSAGSGNTTGNNNTIIGVAAGQALVSGNQNTFLGSNAGSSANPQGSNNVYLNSPGNASDSGIIRIGDSANQTATYVAGVSGAPTNGGVPVFVDAQGKLGTGGGSVSFSQVTGTVASSQLAGTYNNVVTLSNTGNSFAGGFSGSFTGNGSGLTNVPFGTTWPITPKSGSYSVQTSDFSTLTQPGKFLILSGTASATFTLPNPPPSLNGSCVAIGNAADPGINSNANAILTVIPNGVPTDTFPGGASVAPTLPRHTAYMVCTDGTSYFRLGFAQNGVSEIGPVIKTVDTGSQNAMQSTFRNGIDFGLGSGGDGSLISIQPKFANIAGTVTLNLNGLGANKVLKFGQQSLAPGDLNPNTFAVLVWNFNGSYWELVNPQTANGTVTAVTATTPLVSSGGATPNLSCPSCNTTPMLMGTTGSIGGSSLNAGSCLTGTASVTGAAVGHPVSVSASDGSLPNPLIILSASVTSSNTVTVQMCAVANVSTTAIAYNVATQ